jgi:ankyrin repeat protein
MLETLFDMFQNMLDTPDSEGMFPIHWATFNGHRRALELLLLKGVAIDAEATGGFQPKSTRAFSMAAYRAEKGPPPSVKKGGKVEIRRWRESAGDIPQYLLSREATVGNDPSTIDAYRSYQYTIPRVAFMTASGKYEDDEIEREQDTWPNMKVVNLWIQS